MVTQRGKLRQMSADREMLYREVADAIVRTDRSQRRQRRRRGPPMTALPRVDPGAARRSLL